MMTLFSQIIPKCTPRLEDVTVESLGHIKLYRLTVSAAVGTVALSAAAVEERLNVQLERGEVAIAEIGTDYARYCEWVRTLVRRRAVKIGTVLQTPIPERSFT